MTKTSIHAFRVWDSGEQQYMEQSALDNDYDYITIDSNGKLLVFDMYDNPAVLSQGCYTVERFTGFTDKNGRDIYEGDLVCNHAHTYSVFFSNQLMMWMIRALNDPNSIQGIYPAVSIEVVGTVHD